MPFYNIHDASGAGSPPSITFISHNRKYIYEAEYFLEADSRSSRQ
jgi:hypothetical protein